MHAPMDSLPTHHLQDTIIIKFEPLFRRHMNIGNATKNVKIGYLMFHYSMIQKEYGGALVM